MYIKCTHNTCVYIYMYIVKLYKTSLQNNKTVLRTIDECTLTVNMRESAKDSAWTIAGLLHIVAFGGFVDLRMELLFRPCMTIRARISLLAVARLAPFLAVFHIRTWSRSNCQLTCNLFINICLSHSSLIRDCVFLIDCSFYRYLYFRGLRLLSLLLWYCGQA